MLQYAVQHRQLVSAEQIQYKKNPVQQCFNAIASRQVSSKPDEDWSEQHEFALNCHVHSGLDEAILGNMNSCGDPEQDSKKIADLLKYGAHSLVIITLCPLM